MKRANKPFTKMNTKELAAATREFDQEFIADTFLPLDAESKKRHARAKRKRGRPLRGRGAKVVSVTVERSILDQADAFARKHHLTRAALVELGLRMVMRAG
jgi:hypothetical protein